MVVVPIEAMWAKRKLAPYEPPVDDTPEPAPERPSVWQWIRAWYLARRQPSDIRDWDDRITRLEQRFDDAFVNLLAKKQRRR